MSADPAEKERSNARHFSFHLSVAQHSNIPCIMHNARHPFPAAKIISYATEDGDAVIKVTGLVAGDQMRGSCVRRYLCHSEICNLQLTRIVGDRSKHPLIQAFLSLPAAEDSACANGGQSPPTAPGHKLSVDLRQASNAPPAKGGRPRSRGAPRAALVASPTQPQRPAQLGGGVGCAAGLPLSPQPSALKPQFA
jgi:hypothetical protein